MDGASDVDQASITGEPLPAAKAVDDEVFAGTHNGSGVLRVRVERDPTETVIARIVSMVEEASATKAKTQLFIEKIEQRYSLGVVVATVALFFIPLAVGSALQPTLLRAMTFMIVASPCAVVLATMPPLLSAIANAGRHGVLVKSAVVMEQLGNATVVAFDKTGTLTEGRPALTDVRVLAAADIDEASALAFAASAEAASEHPLGRTVVAAARERRISLHRVEDFRSTPGVGVSALVDGRQVAITSPTRIDEHSPQLSGRRHRCRHRCRRRCQRTRKTRPDCSCRFPRRHSRRCTGVHRSAPPGRRRGGAVADRVDRNYADHAHRRQTLVLQHNSQQRSGSRTYDQSCSHRTRSTPFENSSKAGTMSCSSATASTMHQRWLPPEPASPWAELDPTSPSTPRTPWSYATT